MSISFKEPLAADLFDGVARGWAEKVANADRFGNRATQLRRFYDELVMWETRVVQNPSCFDEALPLIRMLNAKAAYAQGRRLVDQTFTSLLQDTLKQVDGPKALTACKHFWEAFMGFYKLHGKD